MKSGLSFLAASLLSLSVNAAFVEHWTVTPPAANWIGPLIRGIGTDSGDGIRFLYGYSPMPDSSQLVEALLPAGQDSWLTPVRREGSPAQRWNAVDLAVHDNIAQLLVWEQSGGRRWLRYLPNSTGTVISTITEIADDTTFAWLELGESGQPFVYFFTGRQLRLAVPAGNGWQVTSLWTCPADECLPLALKRDRQGRVHLLYSSGGMQPQVYYAGQPATNWVNEALTVPGQSATWTGDLALDSSDRPHVVFARKYHDTQYAMGWREPQSGWRFEDPIATSTTITFLQMDMDRFDQPIILEVPGSGDYTAVRRRRDSTSWHTLVAEDVRTYPCVLQLDHGDRALIAFPRNQGVYCSRVNFNYSPTLTNDLMMPPIVSGHPEAAYRGIRVEELLDGHVFDPEGNAWGRMGIAVYAGTYASGWWEYSLDEGVTWVDLRYLIYPIDPNQHSWAALIPHYARMRFVPIGNFAATLDFALPFRPWDRYIGSPRDTLDLPTSRCGGISGFGTNLCYVGVTVLAFTNSAPEMPEVDSFILLDPVAINAAPAENQGTAVAELVSRAHVTDADGDPVGIGVIGVTHEHGTWEFQRRDESAWSTVQGSDEDALLLGPSDRLRMNPQPGYAGRAGFVSFRAWDQTSANPDTRQNGGQTAFSTGANLLAIEVVPTNYAPQLTNDRPVEVVAYFNRALPDDDAPTVGSLLTNRWTDADTNACGIMVYGIRSGEVGEWQFRLTDGSAWAQMPLLPPGFAWLCPPGARLRFVPYIVYPTNVEPALSFQLWDQSSGNAEEIVPTTFGGGYTAISAESGTLHLVVKRWNSATPVLTPSGEDFNLVLTEDVSSAANLGATVQEIFGNRVTDADGDTPGGAVTYFYYPINGVWEYRLPGEMTWQVITYVSPSTYLLLAPDARIRFRPDPDWNGTIPLPLHLNAWDQSFGTSGQLISALSLPTSPANPISVGYVDVFAQVSPMPDPPVVSDGARFEVRFELDGLTGGSASIGQLLQGKVSDPDGDTCGIAIPDARNTGGRWQYSDAAGANWTDVPAITNGSRAFCLSPDRSIRFLPDTTFLGPRLEQGLYFYAWDQTTGSDAQMYDFFLPGGDSCLGQRLAWVDVAKRGFDFLLVSDPGNAADDTGYGSVNYEFQIARTEVCNRDYVAFLNAKAADDPLGLFHTAMTNAALGGIDRLGEPGSYSYVTRTGRTEWPVVGVSWWSAVRFANWIHNGTGSGSTEDGAYHLEGETEAPSNAATVQRQPGARVFIPSANEWYKATYYDPVREAYWEYGIQAEDIPAPLQLPPPGLPGSANVNFANGGTFSSVGAYLYSFSPCGAKDTAGNAREWTESRTGASLTECDGCAGLPPLRGSAAYFGNYQASPNTHDTHLGFRLAAPANYANNAAPVLTVAGNPVVAAGLGPNVGLLVSEILQAIGYDLDSLSLGIAVTSVNRQFGEWQFASTDPGTGELIWHNFGTPDAAHALLLSPTNYVRFLVYPNTSPSGPLPGLSFRAWDQTSGQAGDSADTTNAGGETAFSMREKILFARCDTRIVGDAGNAADDTGYGAVDHDFALSAYEVSNRDYAQFLNAKGTDNTLGLYHTTMSDAQYGGVDQSGVSGSYNYALRPGREDWPVVGVSYYTAIRYANWVHNGRRDGDTESGAYALLGSTELPANYLTITRAADARVFLPTENEWYKAAYYDPVAGTYWEYGVMTNNAPIQEPPPGSACSANFAYAAGGAPTTVGAYTDALSAYGAWDMAGNIREWVQNRVISGSGHRFRGGSYGYPPGQAAASYASGQSGTELLRDVHNGFRLAGILEPSAPPPSIEVPTSPDPGGSLHLRWVGQHGQLYQLQAIEDLGEAQNAAAWENVGDPVPGDNNLVSLPIQISTNLGAIARFYRLLVLPN